MNENLSDHHYIIFSGVFTWPGASSLLTREESFRKQYRPWWDRKDSSSAVGMLGYMKQYFYSTFMEAQFPEHAFLDGKNRLPDMREYLEFCSRRHHLCHLTKDTGESLSGLRFFRKDREQTIQYELPLSVEYGDLYLFPDGTGIFALKTHLDGEGITFGHISDLVYAFREKGSRSFALGTREYTTSELINTFLFDNNEANLFRGGFTDHSFNNKLKSYIVLEADIPVESQEERQDYNNLLYELATVSPIGTMERGGDFAPAGTYRDKILEENAVSVFGNWTALSLFDTFTVLFNRIQEHTLGCAYTTFEDLYYPIYIQNLYLKYVCFTTNGNLAVNGLHSKSNSKVRDRFIEIINRYAFSHISYNFLPNMIHRHLRHSLDLVEEIEQMEQKIDKINTYINEKADGRTNIILGFLSILALGSTFWDMSEWLQKLFHVTDPGYNSLSFTLVFVTGLLCLILLFFLNRKK